MTVNFKPLHTFVLVRRDKAETKTTGFIMSLDPVTLYTGEVLAAGPKCTDVKAGDRIRLETKTSQGESKSVTFDYGRTIKVDGEELVLVKEENIIGIFE